ncbi:hypothetical protein [Flammeovirga sp. SJP92]|uniref:hypothetical protein n=1 Tax=Flammeovirga sp. SJP92 TaxID=1775430 RepID=UPI000786BA57|nr:hypothetical protein [Flammeovirga sp. SJP92]KXX69451.1 hypothetical protein AVL50_19050 [Flammeovirga sp. SJP92]
MIAELYIVPQSFTHNPDLSLEEIESKTQALGNDFIYIKQYSDTNRLKVHSDIYNVEFLEDILLMDLLFNPEISTTIDRDTRVMLQKIIVESEETEDNINDVIDVLLPSHNQNNCYGLISFNRVDNIAPEFQIVYNLSGWFQFRRYFLGLYPKDSEFFIDECSKYFPNLIFHERNKTSVRTIIQNCSNKIIYHLSALNDRFRDSEIDGFNRTKILEHFSIAQNLDEKASPEGDASRKKDFTFKFQNDSGQFEDVCCEPHLKLCYNDNYPGDSSYSTNRRIYFHEGKENIEGGRILIGHIGGHL